MHRPWILRSIAAVSFLLSLTREPCDPGWRVIKFVATQGLLTATAVDAFCEIVVYNFGADDAGYELCLPISVVAGSVAAAATQQLRQDAIVQQVPPHCICCGCSGEGGNDADNADGFQPPLLVEGPPVFDLP